MKTRVEETESKTRIPEVGQCWRHHNDNAIYMRIDDAEGRRARNCDIPNRFFSVHLNSGFIVTTSMTATNIQILEPKGGEMVFVVKD